MKRRLLPQGSVIRDTYTIVRHIGSGAFGDVYLARHRYMGLQAMKVFPFDEQGEVLEEAYLLTKLSHPNIIRMFEANEFEGGNIKLGYFTTEFIEGGTLNQYSESEEQSLSERLSIARQIISGLSFAHEQQPPIIHRDVSPSNILIQVTKALPIAKIGDFGLAKHVNLETRLASAAGKYVYMAPENFLGRHSTASDVYSLGIVLFELLTGRHPFSIELSASMTSSELAAVVKKARVQPIPTASQVNPQLTKNWNEFFRTVLAASEEDRPATAGDLLPFFDRAVADESSSTRNAETQIAKAKELAKQAATLEDAVELLSSLCSKDKELAQRYAPILDLWRRGIVQ